MNLGALLEGKTIFITGASSGIGAHFARVSAACGAHVALAARRVEELRAMESDLTSRGAAGVLSIQLDVADEASARGAIKAAREKFGALDVVVNNAGVAGGSMAMAMEMKEFDSILDVNVRGAFIVAQEAARAWREAKRGGAIINIASVLGFRQAGGVSAYAMSKAAVVQMTKTLALEWARYGIRVNGIAPGYFDTPMNEGYFDSDVGKTMIKRIPMRRIGDLCDLDGPFLLLATEASRFMTGATIPVDGGHLVNSL